MTKIVILGLVLGGLIAIPATYTDTLVFVLGGIIIGVIIRDIDPLCK